MSGGGLREVKRRGRGGVFCTSPSTESERGRASVSPLSISSVTADSRIGLKLLEQIPCGWGVTCDWFFYLGAEGAPSRREFWPVNLERAGNCG